LVLNRLSVIRADTHVCPYEIGFIDDLNNAVEIIQRMQKAAPLIK
jgi:hypothetical protein